MKEKAKFIYKKFDELIELVDRWDILPPKGVVPDDHNDRIVIDKCGKYFVAETYRCGEKIGSEEISKNEVAGIIFQTMRSALNPFDIRMIVGLETAHSHEIPNLWYVEVDSEYDKQFEEVN